MEFVQLNNMLKKEDCKKSQLEVYYGGKTTTMFYFNCSKCNKEIKYRSVELKKISGLCKSCSAKKQIKINSKPKTTKRSFERNYNNFKRLSSKKHTFKITYEQYLTFCNNSKCHYCHSIIKRSETGNKHGQGYYLDRMDNNIGYVFSNVVNCCTRCNFGKSDKYTYDEWFGMTAYFRNN